MAEICDTPVEEVVSKEKNSDNQTPMNEEPTANNSSTKEQDVTTDVSMELSNENGEMKTEKTDDQSKGKYSEEERMKRKAYFKQLREKRRLAREKYRLNYIKRFGSSPRVGSVSDKKDPAKDIVISFNMTEDDKKMLDFYKVRLSTLRSENEQLHRRLSYLVKENMRFLQMGPPMATASFNL